MSLPEIENLTSTYFLDLRLINNSGIEIGNNFYWLSTKKDVLDYEAEIEDWAYYTPSSEYADFTLLNSLPKVSLNVNLSTIMSESKTKTLITHTMRATILPR